MSQNACESIDDLSVSFRIMCVSSFLKSADFLSSAELQFVGLLCDERPVESRHRESAHMWQKLDFLEGGLL